MSAALNLRPENVHIGISATVYDHGVPSGIPTPSAPPPDEAHVKEGAYIPIDSAEETDAHLVEANNAHWRYKSGKVKSNEKIKAIVGAIFTALAGIALTAGSVYLFPIATLMGALSFVGCVVITISLPIGIISIAKKKMGPEHLHHPLFAARITQELRRVKLNDFSGWLARNKFTLEDLVENGIITFLIAGKMRSWVSGLNDVKTALQHQNISKDLADVEAGWKKFLNEEVVPILPVLDHMIAK